MSQNRERMVWLFESTPLIYAIVSAIIGTVFMSGVLWSSAQEKLRSSEKNSMYRIIEIDASIQKQREELLTNVHDLKRSDIIKLARYKKEGLLLPTQEDLVDEIISEARMAKLYDDDGVTRYGN